MAKKKDPAFLFYSKDWLEGTSELMPEEKGVYIDLLATQHQRGDLPTDTRRLAKIVGLSESEFLKIWEGIKNKFKTNGDRMVNQKLTEVVTERSEKAHRNKIIGTLAAAFRLSKESYELRIKAKQGFNIDDFLTIPNHLLTEKITEWFQTRLKSIGNGNAIANAIVNEDRIGSVREREDSPLPEPDPDPPQEVKPPTFGNTIIGEMIKYYQTLYPNDIRDPSKDARSCQLACQQIVLFHKWPKNSFTSEKLKETFTFWKQIVEYSTRDDFYSKLPLETLCSKIDGLIKTYKKSKVNGTHIRNYQEKYIPTGDVPPGGFGQL